MVKPARLEINDASRTANNVDSANSYIRLEGKVMGGTNVSPLSHAMIQYLLTLARILVTARAAMQK